MVGAQLQDVRARLASLEAKAIGLADIDLRVSEEGAFLVVSGGEERKEFRLPIVIDRGVFKNGVEYHQGDGVTWGGSFWIAQRDTKSKPDSGDGAWRLSVKKGRDAKDSSRVVTLKDESGEAQSVVYRDRGAWSAAEAPFSKGDCVSVAGEKWIAQRGTSDKPGKSSAWRRVDAAGRQ
jgi:hypothetical protein